MAVPSPRVLVLLAQGAEEMETTIVVDVLRRAGIEVVLAGVDGPDPVKCSRGVRLLPDCALAEVQGQFDLLVLPGGMAGAERLGASADVGRWLTKQAQAERPIAAICAAPLALAQHRVISGRALTSHPSVRARVEGHGLYREDRVVQDRGLITSRGPGTSFEFALALVTLLCGQEQAERVREPMLLA